jgi:hypothetical protein
MMPVVDLNIGELMRLQSDPGAAGSWSRSGSPPVVVVDLDGAEHQVTVPLSAGVPANVRPGGAPVVVVGTTTSAAGLHPESEGLFPESANRCDLIDTPDGHLAGLVAGTVERNPVASLALVTLLRSSAGLSVSQGLLAESAAYGTLQAGAEFRAWRASVPRRELIETESPVLADRLGDVLHLTLNRPTRRNSFDASMRDSLAEFLELARIDSTIRSVRIDGAGQGFCSGGDLDEFGTASDPSVAHLVRIERSVGAAIDAIRDRVTVALHGACIGSGIELAAFAGHVEADSTVSISLPEVSMGLIPGAGGTVSLVRRIGRHRTCELALTGRSIDGPTALGWGLIDALTQ